MFVRSSTKSRAFLEITLILLLVAAISAAVFYRQNIKQYLINIHAVDILADLKNIGEPNIGRNEVIAKLNYKNLPIVVNKLDRCVCLNIRIRGAWEHQFADKILSLVKPGDTIIELGANYGVYTLPMLDLVGEHGKVYAYEANPMVYKSLLKSYALNEFSSAHLYNVAASNHSGKSLINFGYQNIGGGNVDVYDEHSQANNKFVVDTIKLDEHLAHVQNVQLIKIDIEGSEINVLPHAARIIDSSPELIIALEWSPQQLSKYNSDLQAFAQFFATRQFNVLQLNIDGTISRLTYNDLLQPTHRELLLYKPDAEKLVLSKLEKFIKS